MTFRGSRGTIQIPLDAVAGCFWVLPRLVFAAPPGLFAVGIMIAWAGLFVKHFF
nr:MAG TPA: hypothetical protein [Caudoviricetes sp.]